MIPPFAPAPALPDELSGEFSLRDTQPADDKALYDMCVAQEIAAIGANTTSRDEIAADLSSESALETTTQAVILRGDTIVGWPWIKEIHADHLVADMAIDPELDREQARVLYAWAMQWAEGCGRAALPAVDSGKVQIGNWCYVEDTDQAEWLRAAGYEQHRTFIKMTRTLNADDVYPEPAAGVTIRIADIDPDAPEVGDAPLVHKIIMTAFEDHFNFSFTPFDKWFKHRSDEPGFDPDQWFIADLDGVPLGAMILDRGEEAEFNAGYVHYLGTLREGRGRGLAKSLLWHAFAVNRAEGRATTGLHVDAESPTGATALYESAGMTRERIILDWQRWITA